MKCQFVLVREGFNPLGSIHWTIDYFLILILFSDTSTMHRAWWPTCWAAPWWLPLLLLKLLVPTIANKKSDSITFWRGALKFTVKFYSFSFLNGCWPWECFEHWTFGIFIGNWKKCYNVENIKVALNQDKMQMVFK